MSSNGDEPSDTSQGAQASRGEAISVVDFYGSQINHYRESPRFHRIRARESAIRDKPIAEHPRPTLTNPVDSTWLVFDKQAPALELCSKRNYELRTFALEINRDGRRNYLVAHPEVFWKVYVQRNPKQRHNYEVIPEYQPCKLYFDLEYYREFNPEANGEQMVEKVVNAAVETFKSEFDVEVNPQDCVVDLSASTQKKFSRHLIFDVPELAFEDNYAVGKFVELVVNKLPDLTVVKDAEGQKTSFVDTAVFTKNRNFRLILSSKFGQTNVLEPTGKWKKCISNRELFLSSLVSVPFSEGRRLLSFDSFENDDEVQNVERPFQRHPSGEVTKNLDTSSIETFVESLVRPGRIRRKLVTENLLVFDIDGNYRFCENIGRAHKSNHVKIIVDLSLEGYCQGCYDPDCREYRSPLKRLPENLIQEIRESRKEVKKVEKESDNVGDDVWGEMSDSDLALMCDAAEMMVAGDDMDFD
jgi:hypothetical protein